MKITNVLIVGASPDRTNRNTTLRQYVVEGFQQLLGSDNVTHGPLELAAEITRERHPNLVVCFGSCMPDEADYSELRYACDKSNSILAFWLHDDPYEFDFSFKVCRVADYIFTNDKWASLHYNHERVFHMPLAASKAAHWKPLSEIKDVDIFFCGVAFPNRIRLVADLRKVLAKYNTIVLGDQWPCSQFPFATNMRLTSQALSDYYSRSRLTLNIGRDFHYANNRYKLEPSTPGPRTFEAGMAGTTQLYFVDSLEILDYYVPNKEIILFDSVVELEKIIANFDDGLISANDIQAAAQARTLNDHTYLQRAISIIGSIVTNKSSGILSSGSSNGKIKGAVYSQ